MAHVFRPGSHQSPISLGVWALINVGSLLAIYGANQLWPEGTGDYVLWAYGLLTLGPACAAGIFDGRVRALGTLVLSTWGVLAAVLIALMQTESWSRDCGLGQAFTVYFTWIAALAYPVVSAVSFGIGRVIAAGIAWADTVE